MEKNVAILIADLSGYTALTEVHGAASAADMVDRYLSLVEKSLVGDCELHERVGDEILMISNNADDMLCTALLLLNNCVKEHHFLLLHGGLHWGKLLNRNKSWFGTALNLASRIASKAAPGTFWCSGEFYNVIQSRNDVMFIDKGLQSFKNITDPKQVYELVAEETGFLAVDPICRMLIHSKEKAWQHPGEDGVYFCSQECLTLYIANKVVNNT